MALHVSSGPSNTVCTAEATGVSQSGGSSNVQPGVNLTQRMVQDLGIHLDGRMPSGAPDRADKDDTPLRQHSFWSTYLWDKISSLYLGRAPMLQISPSSPSLHLGKWLTDFAEPR